MRSSKSRSRSKGNRNNNRNVGNVVNRVFDSSGPEGKVRGTPQQIIDKYNQLTRDSQLSNDRVAAENFQQHAEHYTRMLAEALREQQEKQDRQQQHKQNQQHNQNNTQNNQGGQDNQGHQSNQNNQNNHGQQPSQDAQNQPRHGDDKSVPDKAPARKPRAPRPAKAKNDDVIDLEQDSDDSGLVETPEERPERPKRTRRKAPTADASDQPDVPATPTPDAAE